MTAGLELVEGGLVPVGESSPLMNSAVEDGDRAEFGVDHIDAGVTGVSGCGAPVVGGTGVGDAEKSN
ncbi:hypothetical protein K7432_013139 [Basidiobolus ranarum]|uniref:Uncharacterized protein n=1 Tax=Basidiobolus ranarum TaxID=34480 RepID=A0ABR2WJP5_9FUNG